MTPLRRVRLIAEIAALYIVAPLAVYHLVYSHQIPLLRLLIGIFTLFIVFLTFDRSFSWFKMLAKGFSIWQGLQILVFFLIFGGAIAAYAAEYHPDRFLAWPRRDPDSYYFIMMAYPLISVTTQEIIFRVFFFHRYSALFGSAHWLAILVNAGLFSFGHIIIPSWTSFAVTFLGGLLFGYRYDRTRSFWAVALEHSLYGNLIFTVGLGRYFYTGVSNLG